MTFFNEVGGSSNHPNMWNTFITLEMIISTNRLIPMPCGVDELKILKNDEQRGKRLSRGKKEK